MGYHIFHYHYFKEDNEFNDRAPIHDHMIREKYFLITWHESYVITKHYLLYLYGLKSWIVVIRDKYELILDRFSALQKGQSKFSQTITIINSLMETSELVVVELLLCEANTINSKELIVMIPVVDD